MSSRVEAEFPPLSFFGASVIATTVVSFALSSFAVSLRIWARRLRKASILVSEDILCYLALLCQLAVSVNYICLAVIGGFGYHIAQLQPLQVRRLYKIIFVFNLIWPLPMGFIKLSIARLFQHIFITRKFQIAGYIVIGLSTCWIIQTVLIGILICQPVERNWNPEAPGSCGDHHAALASVAGVNVLTDLMLLLLPIKPLMTLQITRRQKITLATIFSGGFITVIITIVRLCLVYTINFADMSYVPQRTIYMAIWQPAIGMMVACGPLLKPIMDRVGSTLNGQLSASSLSSMQPQGSRQFSIFAAKRFRRRWPDASLLVSSSSDHTADSEQQSRPEFGNKYGNHQCICSPGAAIPDFNSGIVGFPNEECIMVTSQVTVAISEQGVDYRLESHPPISEKWKLDV
ncbi:hypothetical protein GGR54DRAFT_646914 [Hypoxylon sp. NC1633]|nr:hypothetical protein GGR54DRAFT_646914 [Hypoxylon sp. NC1633]